MAIMNAPEFIATPQPPPRPYGIFDVALGPMPFPVPASQAGGVLYVPDTCNSDVFLYAMNCPPVSGSKTFSTNEFPVSGAPFAVITSYTCGALGYSFEEAEQKVRTRGAIDLGPSGCVTEAIEVLEQALADNGVIGGMIHARPGISAHLQTSFLLYEGPGRVKRTVLNTPYVFGQGYDGSGPTGQPADTNTEWLYASGRVVIWQSDVEVPDPRQTFDRRNNQQMLLAERIYAVAIECGVWATQVTRNCVTAGSA